jgi:HK97 gp10 family phage protein
MPIDLRPTGFEALHGRIRALRAVLHEQAVREGVRAGAAVIRDEIETRCPELDEKTARSTSLDPGAMKADIGLRMHATNKEGYAIADIGPGERTEHVANWVEYGHRVVKGGYSKATYKNGAFVGYRGPGRQLQGEEGKPAEVAPHPFIRPAYEATIETSQQACIARVREFIAEELGK